MSAAIQVPNPHGVQIVDWPWTFRVPRQSGPGTCFVWWDRMRCDCPAGRHAQACKHVRWVDAYCRLIWRQAIHRMTAGPAGRALLNDILDHIEDAP